MTFKNNQDKKDIGSFFYALKRRYQLHKQLKQRRAIRVPISPKTKVIVWGSAGKLGFKSNKRTTPYAAELLGKYLSRFLKRRQIKFINFEISRKFNKKYRSFFKGFNQAGLKILRVYYKRKVMFGSIRRPKIRRI